MLDERSPQGKLALRVWAKQLGNERKPLSPPKPRRIRKGHKSDVRL